MPEAAIFESRTRCIGDGPIDLVWAPGYLSHLEQNQWWPSYASLIERMASFSRLIVFDRRGTGLSDRILSLGSFEELLDDITAVLDAASSERAALFGGAESGPMCALYAATFRSACRRSCSAPRIPAAQSLRASRGASTRIGRTRSSPPTTRGGARRAFGVRSLAPSLADDERFRQLARAGVPVCRHPCVGGGLVSDHDGDRHPGACCRRFACRRS